MVKFLDTSSLLSIEDYNSINEEFYISSKTIEELENIKTSTNKTEELRFKAREAVRFLDSNAKYSVVFVNKAHFDILDKLGLEHTNDNVIIACAKSVDEQIEFYSEDLLCRLIAKDIFGLQVTKFKTDKKIYTGHIKITGDTEYINNYIDNIDFSNWYVNQYLIIENTDDKKTTEMRYNGNCFVSLKLPSSNYIKAKNPLQRCALDLLMNKNITTVAILGGYGSGKTMLSTQMALYHVNEKGNQSKVLGIRECSGEGKEIGYLKGTFEDKTGKFFKPIEQQLKGGEFELNSLINQGVLETNIPFYLKGTTYNNTIMVVDEAEDLTESQIRLIGTRLGENSKIYFAGDYNQSLINKTKNNALVKMCDELKGNHMFGCIVLDEDVRSQTSKMFANLFK